MGHMKLEREWIRPGEKQTVENAEYFGWTSDRWMDQQYEATCQLHNYDRVSRRLLACSSNREAGGLSCLVMLYYCKQPQ